MKILNLKSARQGFILLSSLLLLIIAGCEDTPADANRSGFDINGKQSSCEPMKEKVCTEVFTTEDQFALKCGKEGHEVIKCDCHKYLCNTKDGKPLEFNAPDL